MIEYVRIHDGWNVRLEGRLVGQIYVDQRTRKYHYRPKGGKPGQGHDTLASLKSELERA